MLERCSEEREILISDCNPFFAELGPVTPSAHLSFLGRQGARASDGYRTARHCRRLRPQNFFASLRAAARRQPVRGVASWPCERSVPLRRSERSRRSSVKRGSQVSQLKRGGQ
jgi:hypothetical protein